MNSAQSALRAYRQRHGLTWGQVAERCGISADYARRIGCGLRARTSSRIARQIEKRTRGEIRAVDLVL